MPRGWMESRAYSSATTRSTVWSPLTEPYPDARPGSERGYTLAVSSDCLLLSLPQGIDRQRLDGWRHQHFDLGEGEEQGYHRAKRPQGEWSEIAAMTMRGRPD